MKRILYIGNNFAEKSKYNSTMATLSELLSSEGYEVICSSDKTNKIKRILNMCLSVIKNRNNIDFVLIDTFSTFNFYYAFIISQLSRFFSLKYIPILHGGNLPNRLDKSKVFSKMIFNNSFENITPSIYLQQAFEEKEYKTNYIPNSIPIKEYKFKLRQIIKPRILWVRAFDKTYNPLMAVKVLVILRKHFSNVQLCMVGPEKDETLNEVKLVSKKLNVIDHITFTGVLSKEEWHLLSNKYDIFINTTNIDNMPVSVIEAMALGFPIVSTNAGGLPYLINHGKDGMLVAKSNEVEMAKAIIELIENPLKVIELSKNARAKAETFDIEIIKKHWLTLLS